MYDDQSAMVGTKTMADEKPKSYMNDPEMPKTKDYVNHGGLSRQAIFQAVNASLKRLEMDYIDLLQIHRFDNDVPIEETMQALHDLVRSGKVRYIGASSVSLTSLLSLCSCNPKRAD